MGGVCLVVLRYIFGESRNHYFVLNLAQGKISVYRSALYSVCTLITLSNLFNHSKFFSIFSEPTKQHEVDFIDMVCKFFSHFIFHCDLRPPRARR